MNVYFATSELVPFSKTGGLADVSAALPPEIGALGSRVAVFTPYYRHVKRIEPQAKVVAEGTVPVGQERVPFTLHVSNSSKGNVKIYFIGCEQYFDREGLYGNEKGDFEDNCSRFIHFSRACLSAAEMLGHTVDIWHAHDWQTALIPVLLKTAFVNHDFHRTAASVFTIHNMSYQGMFWHWDWPLFNLAWKHFNWHELEFHGKINLLKGALVHAQMLTTVSPTYAREIQTPELGFGLEGVLLERTNDLAGIVNGIDAAAWNPRRDPLLPAEYSPENMDGKRICKDVLRRKFNLPDGPGAVIGMIGRLIEQKGFDLVAQGIEELLRRDVQIVILGTGREDYHKLLQRLQQSHPKQLGVAFAFDNALAHLIEAGSDMFLMPSKFEPCGLNQLYSLAYGTPPVVHNVGGLADTVVDTTPETLAAGTATGFTFDAYTPEAMLSSIDRALQIYSREPDTWRKLQTAGMSKDWSWRNSASKYVEVYERAIKRKG